MVSLKTSNPLELRPEINDWRYSSRTPNSIPKGTKTNGVLSVTAFMLLIANIPKIKYSTKCIALSYCKSQVMVKLVLGVDETIKINTA